MIGWVDAMLVAAGGFCGAIARYTISKRAADRFQSAVPYGTLAINVSGSGLLGLLAGSGTGDTVMLLAGTGFMGAYTTFSTFALESVTLLSNRRYRAFLGYAGATYGLGILFAYIGFCVGRALVS